MIIASSLCSYEFFITALAVFYYIRKTYTRKTTWKNVLWVTRADNDIYCFHNELFFPVFQLARRRVLRAYSLYSTKHNPITKANNYRFWRNNNISIGNRLTWPSDVWVGVIHSYFYYYCYYLLAIDMPANRAYSFKRF